MATVPPQRPHRRPKRPSLMSFRSLPPLPPSASSSPPLSKPEAEAEKVLIANSSQLLLLNDKIADDQEAVSEAGSRKLRHRKWVKLRTCYEPENWSSSSGVLFRFYCDPSSRQNNAGCEVQEVSAWLDDDYLAGTYSFCHSLSSARIH